MRSEAWDSLHSELTSVGIMKTGFGTSHKPFFGEPVNTRDSLETSAFIDTDLSQFNRRASAA
jgi:hypothetical protein